MLFRPSPFVLVVYWAVSTPTSVCSVQFFLKCVHTARLWEDKTHTEKQQGHTPAFPEQCHSNIKAFFHYRREYGFVIFGRVSMCVHIYTYICMCVHWRLDRHNIYYDLLNQPAQLHPPPLPWTILGSLIGNYHQPTTSLPPAYQTISNILFPDLNTIYLPAKTIHHRTNHIPPTLYLWLFPFWFCIVHSLTFFIFISYF